MKKLNQSGIAHLATIIIVVLIAAVGVAGWRVYEVSKENKQLKETSSKTESTEQKDEEAAADTEQLPTYSNDVPKFSFAYPTGWNVEKQTKAGYTSIVITSSDFAEKEEELCTTLLSGVKFSIYLDKDFSDPDIVSKKLTSTHILIKNQKKTTLGGLAAVEYDESPGECGYLHSITVYKDGYNINLLGYRGVELGQYSDEFQAIAESFKFN